MTYPHRQGMVSRQREAPMFRRLRLYIRGVSEPDVLQRPLPYTEDVVLAEILKLVREMMSKLDELTAKVDAVRTVEDSAITLIEGISQALKDALAKEGASGISDADAQAIIDKLDSGKTALASAVSANTPPPAPTPAAVDVPTIADTSVHTDPQPAAVDPNAPGNPNTGS